MEEIILRNEELCKQIVDTQQADHELRQSLEMVKEHGPRALTKGMDDWDIAGELMLY